MAALSELLMESRDNEGATLQNISFSTINKMNDDSRDIHVLNTQLMGNRAIVISNLLSAEECASVMSFMNSNEIVNDNISTPSSSSSVMTPANSKKEYRNCLRMCSKNEETAAEIFTRITPILIQLGEDSKVCSASNAAEYLQDGLGMHGTWKMDSVNSFFRLCKYYAGGHFAPHFDSDYILDPINHRSLKTLMIYLNDDYSAGETQFCDEHALYYDAARKVYCSPDECVHTRWKPRQGDCILFDHRLLHEGAVVTSGEKYIMRSELMYRKEVVSIGGDEGIKEEDSEKSQQEQAIRLWFQGCELESGGQVTEAINLYRRAYKLYPALDDHFK